MGLQSFLGKVLVWDATCPDTLAPSYSTLAVREAGAVEDEAERRKVKYAHLENSHLWLSKPWESLGPRLVPFLKTWVVT